MKKLAIVGISSILVAAIVDLTGFRGDPDHLGKSGLDAPFFSENGMQDNKVRLAKDTEDRFIRRVEAESRRRIEQRYKVGEFYSGWSSQGQGVFDMVTDRSNESYLAMVGTDPEKILTVFNLALNDVTIPSGKKLHRSVIDEKHSIKDSWVPALDFFNIRHQNVDNVVFIIEQYFIQNGNALCDAVAGKVHFVANEGISSTNKRIFESIARSVERLPLACDVPVNVNDGHFQLKSYYPDGREMLGLNERAQEYYSYHKVPITNAEIWTFFGRSG